MIHDALIASGGNKLKAAQRLGLSRQGLFKKLKKLGLPAA
jgi:transcriptional regulator of acetoin/glycerol metabolism